LELAPLARGAAPPLAAGDEALVAAAGLLAAGQILAVKGLGGYHLACDALDGAAVARLRARKGRDARPLALMAPDLATAQELCAVSADEAALLQSRRRPIVLLRRLPPGAGPDVPDAVSTYHTLGIMLPYTPLHELLLRDFAAAVGPDRPAALVMTSGNRSDEPIAYRDDDARARLTGIADALLSHDRAIHIRCDDSVSRVVAGGEQIFRRARGYAPEPIALALASPAPLLACGGHLKNTFCLLKGRQAFVSHHIGDLENLETLVSFREGVAHYRRLFNIEPMAVAYDLHPDYIATQEALALELPHAIGVQHHHAHIASVLAEHGLAGPVIGVAADGSGYGADGAVWGCEVLRADLRGYERLAHLAYVPLPGGERAVRQPWRVAAALLAQAYGEGFLDLDIPFVREHGSSGRPLAARWRPLAQMIARQLNSPPTSSLGRLFDAVAALLRLRDEVSYEGQAAIELEQIAAPGDGAYPFTITAGAPMALDVAPLIRAIVDDIRRAVPPPLIAGRFHRTIVELLAEACLQARLITCLDQVALSGGVFQNRTLLTALVARLEELRFRVYLNRRVPPNDGGLSLGQAAIAAATLDTGRDL
ncbi:MAG: carbamoyltransferase HypF, partial [Chloroflexales bacterium]|nr:carbamoyltransferase HypF [Chloroflexales bacterium]